MKAVHVSWAILLGAAAVILAQVSLVMQGHTPDWTAIGTAVMAIVGSFTPAAQLAFTGLFFQPPHQRDMPVLIPPPMHLPPSSKPPSPLS